MSFGDCLKFILEKATTETLLEYSC
jgi:hypothetical protein